MRTIFILITMIGIASLVAFILIGANPLAVNRYKNKIKIGSLTSKLQNENLDHLLNSCGLPIDSRFYNSIRYGVILLYVLFTVIQTFLRPVDFGIVRYLLLIALSVVWIVVSNAKAGFPAFLLLTKIQKIRADKKNGQLLAFIHLYRNDRSKDGRRTQFSYFCRQVAPSLPLLERELMELASRTTEDGIESAMRWFERMFPEDHDFAKEIFSMILSTEKATNLDAVRSALLMQGELLARVSSNRYSEKWKNIGDISTAMNTVPAIIILMTMIILIFKYISIINKNLFN